MRKKKFIRRILKILNLYCSNFQFTITKEEYRRFTLFKIMYFIFIALNILRWPFCKLLIRVKASYFLFNLGKISLHSHPVRVSKILIQKIHTSTYFFPADTKITSVLVKTLQCVTRVNLWHIVNFQINEVNTIFLPRKCQFHSLLENFKSLKCPNL